MRVKKRIDRSDNLPISTKTNRVLNIILFALFLIFIRVWYLATLCHDDLLEKARQPGRRSVIERTERATIRDRFNIPLAINKMRYRAGIYYSDIRRIPSNVWEVNEQGQKIKIPARARYIAQISKLLAEELDLDADRIEDLIHSKASLFPNVPYILKEEITETQYYRLKMLEKDWQGVWAESNFKRIYPRGKTACDIIGYLGAINDREHLSIAREITELKKYLEQREAGETPLLPHGYQSPIEVRNRLKALKEKSYTINDVVGKTGIEGLFEEQLRGFYTKKFYEVDRTGAILRELPGSRKSIGGQRMLLTLSAELQEFAESLLALYETKAPHKAPWIKGGAIVAMIPNTGEIVALASHPRFDPNDFISKDPSLFEWLENETHIANLWDGKVPFTKEVYSKEQRAFVVEEHPFTWDIFLSMILNKESHAYKTVNQIKTIEQAIHLQRQPLNASEEDGVFIRDLCRLIANQEDLDDELLNAIGSHSLSQHLANCQKVAKAQSLIRPVIQKHFHDNHFKAWRTAHFKEFLKLKRKDEKENKKYPLPYLDYLDKMEKTFFQEFWDEHRLTFLDAYFNKKERHGSQDLASYVGILLQMENTDKLPLNSLSREQSLRYLKSLRNFNDLTFPLEGSYRMLRNAKKHKQGKILPQAFIPLQVLGMEDLKLIANQHLRALFSSW